MRLASCMSLGIIVTRFAWMAHRLVSSNKPIKYASEASCSARTAVDWKRYTLFVCLPYSSATSRTNLENGAFRINNSVFFWYRLISLNATVPGRYLWGFLTVPGLGKLFLTAFVRMTRLGRITSEVLGLFPALCLIRAIFFFCVIELCMTTHGWTERTCHRPNNGSNKNK
jgi:hypothetical protein